MIKATTSKTWLFDFVASVDRHVAMSLEPLTDQPIDGLAALKLGIVLEPSVGLEPAAAGLCNEALVLK